MREGLAAIRRDKEKLVSMILLTADYRQEDGNWLAECLELGVATYGTTLEEAKEDLSEAIDLQLTEVDELGFIKEYLKEHGVQIHPFPTQPEERHTSWANVGLVSV